MRWFALLLGLLLGMPAAQAMMPPALIVNASGCHNPDGTPIAAINAAIGANAAATITLTKNIDAACENRLGIFQRNLITNPFNGGQLVCNGFGIYHINIVNDEFVFINPPLGLGVFASTTSVTGTDCTFEGKSSQTSTTLDGTNQTYRDGAISAYSTNDTWTNTHIKWRITTNGYFNYNAAFPNVTGSTFHDFFCELFITASVTANNTINGCFAQVFSGTFTGVQQWRNGGILQSTGFSPGLTQNCTLLPIGGCPTTAGYDGYVGVLGFSSLADYASATGLDVDQSVNVTNSLNNGLGNTGACVGIMFNALLHDIKCKALVNGANNVAPAVGSVRLSPPSVMGPTGSSEAYNIDCGGVVSGTTNTIGRCIGTNVGYLHDFFSDALVLSPNAVNVGLVGRNFAQGVVLRGYGWFLLSANSAAGGGVGRDDPASGGVSQMYTMGRVAAASTFGAFFGVCNNLAAASSLYFNSTWSNIQKACGSADASAEVTGLTDTQLRSALPAGFDPTKWIQHPICGYPILNFQLANPPQCPSAPNAPIIIPLRPGSGTVTLPSNFNSFDNQEVVVSEDGLSGFGTASLAGSAGGSAAVAANFNRPFAGGATISYYIPAGGTGTGAWIYDPTWLFADWGKSASGNIQGTGGTVLGSIGDLKIGGTSGGKGGNCSGGGGAAPGGADGTGGAAGGGGINCTPSASGGSGAAADSSTTGNGVAGIVAGGNLGGQGSVGTPGTSATATTSATQGTGNSGSGAGWCINTGLCKPAAKGIVFDISGGTIIPPIGYGTGSGGGGGARTGLTLGGPGADAPGFGASAGAGGFPLGVPGAPGGGGGWIITWPL